MGLDSYWKGTGIGVTFDPPLRLVGGMLSGNGDGSFRGKCYSDLIERVTGESLYQERIEPVVVKKMADKLAKYKYNKVDEAVGEDVSPEEFKDLQRMFKAYSEAGHALHGWW